MFLSTEVHIRKRRRLLPVRPKPKAYPDFEKP